MKSQAKTISLVTPQRTAESPEKNAGLREILRLVGPVARPTGTQDKVAHPTLCVILAAHDVRGDCRFQGMRPCEAR